VAFNIRQGYCRPVWRKLCYKPGVTILFGYPRYICITVSHTSLDRKGHLPSFPLSVYKSSSWSQLANTPICSIWRSYTANHILFHILVLGAERLEGVSWILGVHKSWISSVRISLSDQPALFSLRLPNTSFSLSSALTFLVLYVLYRWIGVFLFVSLACEWVCIHV
jgi:hypothetical protein